MNEIQKFLFELYRDFGDNAQKALDFVRKNEAECKAKPTIEVASPISETRKNGVYLLLNSGEIVPYTADNCKNVKMIAIFHDGHSFGVPLDGDLGEHPLLKSDEHPKDSFCVNECQALLDWDFVGNTKHIQEIGTNIPLKEGQYLPTAPVWLAMYANKDALNNALKDCGGTPIDFTKEHWFAQRYYVHHAWIFGGTYGNLYGNGVCSSYSVRAVSPLL